MRIKKKKLLNARASQFDGLASLRNVNARDINVSYSESTLLQSVAVRADNFHTNVFIIIDPNTNIDIANQIQDAFRADKFRVTVDAARHEFYQKELDKLTREIERYSRLLGEDAPLTSLMPSDFSTLLVWKKKIESCLKGARAKAFNADSWSQVPLLSLNSRVFRFTNRLYVENDLICLAHVMARFPSKFNAMNKSEGIPVLYFSRDIPTLFFERSLHFIDLVPMKTILTEVSVALERVVDLTDPITQAMVGVESSDFIRCVDPEGESPVQQLGSALSAAGFQGAIYPSSARFEGSNLVIFARNITNPSSLSVTNRLVI